MDLEKFFELLFSNPDNIHLEYSNINGQESLRINGEEVIDTPDEYDDTSIKEYIARFKDNIQSLDDCTFVEVIDEIEHTIDIQSLDELISQESFTEDEAELIYGQLNFINTVIHDKLTNKVQNIIELLDRL